MKNFLTGTGVAIVTPFTKKGTVDVKALERLIKHLINGKVEYIVVNGTTAESVTLTKQEKQLVIDTVVKTNKKRLPLVLGIGGNNTAEVVEAINEVYELDGGITWFDLLTRLDREDIYQLEKVASPTIINSLKTGEKSGVKIFHVKNNKLKDRYSRRTPTRITPTDPSVVIDSFYAETTSDIPLASDEVDVIRP